MAVFAVSVVNCTFAPVRYLSVAEPEQRVTVLDRYTIHFFGGPPGQMGTLQCYFDFTTKHLDTTRLDTIPILVVDSLCFSGSCLTNGFCLHPQTERERAEARQKEKIPSQYVNMPADLGFNGYELFPVPCTVDTAVDIPDKCGKHDICVGVKARLIDRTSGKELAEELTEVQFEILERKPYLPGPKVPIRLR